MKRTLILSFLVLSLMSCTNDDDPKFEVEKPEINKNIEITRPDTLAGNVSVYNDTKVQEGYVLVNDASNNRVYLMEKENSKILNEWHFPEGIGNDAVLLENGNILVALMDEDPAFQFGGYGGKMAIVSPEGEILWQFEYSDENNLSHHDIEMLPNGNVLFLAWERKNGIEIDLAGYTGTDEELFIEKILEIDPTTDQIVWEWSSWDHLVQNSNENAQNFGSVSDHPERIDINYMDEYKEGSYNGDTMHANALEYDEDRDLIYLSVNFYSEVWVIDHSTSTSQAKTGEGGDFGKGGDLIYRFGNPDAYQNSIGERTFFHNHNPTLVPNSNRILVFSNGLPVVDAHSKVYEMELPTDFELGTNVNNELDVFWSYNHDDLFSAKVSGAHRLPNGNTLITQGTSGYWEVTSAKEIVWRFEGRGFFWRGYHYDKDGEAIRNLGL